MTTSALTVTDFVLARIAEDEARATRASSSHWPVVANAAAGCSVDAGWHVLDHSPARVLAQCAAMRKIMEWHSPAPHPRDGEESYGTILRRGPICEGCSGMDDIYVDQVPYPCGTIRALASIWSDHPDFREEWA